MRHLGLVKVVVGGGGNIVKAHKALFQIYRWWFSGECCSNYHTALLLGHHFLIQGILYIIVIVIIKALRTAISSKKRALPIDLQPDKAQVEIAIRH